MIPAFIADRENKKRRGELGEENRIGAELIDIQHIPAEDDDDDDDEVVMETKGSTYQPPSPMAEARAQIALDQERARIEQAAAERRAQQEAQERAARIQQASAAQNTAYNSAIDYGREQIAGRGINEGLADQYGILDLYNSGVGRTRQSIAEDDTNPMSSYNLTSLFSDALDTATGKYRGDLRNDVYGVAGDGFEYNLFADTADDDILQTILDSRKSDAQAQIDAAYQRGQLNDVGYGRAGERLGQQGESAMADLQDLGLGVLSGYRDSLRGFRDDQLDKIGMTTFTDPYNFDSFNNRLSTMTSDFQNRMRGDLFRATEGQTFFDPASLIASSGAIQGFYNPSTPAASTQSNGTGNPLVAAFAEDEKKKTSGSTNGVF